MKPFLILVILAVGIVPLSAQEPRLTLDWEQLQAAGQPAAGVPVTLDGRKALRIENTASTPLRASLATVENPPLERRGYAIRGEVRYEGVSGDGFLEMWSRFPPVQAGGPEPRYFSRTLGLSGPMGKITGTSGWREFVLPFDPTGASGAPTGLELNLHLPGPGRVYLGPLTLIQYSTPGLQGLTSSGTGGWWSARTGGMIGGVVGATVGILGAIAGTLARRGRGRPFVVGLMVVLLVFAAGSLLAGLFALAVHQPAQVFGTLLFVGVLLLSILPFHLRQFRQQYAEQELRRMRAVDAG